MNEYLLEEEKGHKVAYFEYGNPNGVPILNFHGGPGSKSKPKHAEKFDLSKYRVILFDQRGCGKSSPLGKLEDNTTDDILSDAERIREELGIDKWFISGASWGSTCALLYAMKYPDRVHGILISAVFTADRDSVMWGMNDEKGAARLLPDVWMHRMDFFKKFNISIENQNTDMLRALEKGTLEEQKEIAAGIFNWEANLFSSQSPITYTNSGDITEENIASAKIFVHYEHNHSFISEKYILGNIEKISDLPTVMVHGRYDILCPLEKVWELKNKMNNCKLVIATSSGHKLTPEGETIQRMAYESFLEKVEVRN